MKLDSPPQIPHSYLRARLDETRLSTTNRHWLCTAIGNGSQKLV
ncbi:hypothetical protein [Novipirellula caenicola]